jgi:hypothetical protein
VYPILFGVPQGSILGPLLFLHFNGAYLPLKHYRILMYADDTVLYYAHKEVSIIEEKLTEDLSRISEWFEQNELMVNLKKGKTECMLFGTGKNLSKNDDHVLNIKLKEELVNNVTSYSYLGILLDQTLCLGDHFNKIYKRAFWTGQAFMETETIYVYEFRSKSPQCHGNACYYVLLTD